MPVGTSNSTSWASLRFFFNQVYLDVSLCFWFFVTDIKKARGVLYIAHVRTPVPRSVHAYFTHDAAHLRTLILFRARGKRRQGRERGTLRAIAAGAAAPAGVVPGGARVHSAGPVRRQAASAQTSLQTCWTPTRSSSCARSSPRTKKIRSLKVSSPSWTKRRAFPRPARCPRHCPDTVVRHLRQKVGI